MRLILSEPSRKDYWRTHPQASFVRQDQTVRRWAFRRQRRRCPISVNRRQCRLPLAMLPDTHRKTIGKWRLSSIVRGIILLETLKDKPVSLKLLYYDWAKTGTEQRLGKGGD